MPEPIPLQSKHSAPLSRRALVVIRATVGRTNVLLPPGPVDELLSIALGFLACVTTMLEEKMGAI